jgi:HSP20 family protein
MKNLEKHIENLVYPGVYMPLYQEDELEDELKHLRKNAKKVPAVNVIEMDDTFKVEMSIPGVKRECFFVHADGNILSVSVIQKEQIHPESAHFQKHEFNCDCYDRQIILPENTDTEFVSAEYQSGILRLHIPKIKNPGKDHHTRIAVY